MTDVFNVLPRDKHNEALVANTHPLDWKNPEPAPRYNLVVIGAGTAGLVTAAGAAGLGAKVALVEKQLLRWRLSECRMRAVEVSHPFVTRIRRRSQSASVRCERS
jgi:cation diffusion facilitator CzcD-associated flavoprotein CzcO